MTNPIDRLEARLKKIEISRSEFARRLDISPQTYNGWKVRKTIPGPQIFNAAQVAECDPVWLATGETVEDTRTVLTSDEHAFDYELYESVLIRVIHTMKEIDMELDTTKIARIAYICYNHKANEKPPSKQEIMGYLRLAS